MRYNWNLCVEEAHVKIPYLITYFSFSVSVWVLNFLLQWCHGVTISIQFSVITVSLVSYFQCQHHGIVKPHFGRTICLGWTFCQHYFFSLKFWYFRCFSLREKLQCQCRVYVTSPPCFTPTGFHTIFSKPDKSHGLDSKEGGLTWNTTKALYQI